MEYKIADDRRCPFLLKCDPIKYAALYSKLPYLISARKS